MNPHNESPDCDPFDDLLKELNELPKTRPELADVIFARTRGVLASRRWMRRGRLLMAFVACYACGIGSGWLLKTREKPQLAAAGAAPVSNVQPVSNTEAVTAAVPGPPVADRDSLPRTVAPAVPPIAEAPSQRPPTAVAVEDAAASALAARQPPMIVQSDGAGQRKGPSQFENFRRAGDRQLFERGNVRNAMDCYRRALSHANDQELRIQIDRDSWLLMSLKQSRMEERKHVRPKRV